MAFIFRLQQEGGDNTKTGWNDSTYNQKMINEIEDPNLKDTSKQITSIPSPFARIDLVKTAFKEVVNSKNIDGDTIYHKIVSDTLDVAQIFFESEKIKGLKIMEWGKSDCEKLLNSSNPKHQRLGQTLKTYIETDEANNLKETNSLPLYILSYNGSGVTSESFIGATSPRTLFFSSANDYSSLSEKISFGNDKPFDKDYCPLHKRDLEFVKSLYAFRKGFKSDNSSFAELFPEVNDYMNECKKLLEEDHRNEINQVEAADNYYANGYDKIPVDGNSGNCVRIMDNYYLRHRIQDIKVSQESDFVIKSEKSAIKPLVLPVDTFTNKTNGKAFRYVGNIFWDPKVKAPLSDSQTNISERVLPNIGIPYPYLTVGDFLEDNIIKINNDINAKYFFDGRSFSDEGNKGNGIENNEGVGCFLLPLKDAFFDYFTVNDLMENNLISVTVNHSNTAVTVKLNIPVKGGTIPYTKQYIEHENVLVEDPGPDFFIVPDIAVENSENSFSRVALVLPKGASSNDYSLICYNDTARVYDIREVVRNTEDKRNRIGKVYSIDKVKVDHFRLNVKNDVSGLIIPRERKQRKGNEIFTFAIDFGTTNTHIEYKIGEGASKKFEINEQDIQLIQLTKDDDTILKSVYENDLLPKTIGTKDSEYSFPTRTALSYGKETNWGTPVVPLAHANIPYTFEKHPNFEYNKIITGLKWSDEEHNQSQISCYIENLFILLRDKVLLNNGSLKDTKIVWFYPISMTTNRFNLFCDEWKRAYEKYFGGNADDNVIPMTESLAPYEYYKADRLGTNLVTIDIGGGTTDVVIAPDDNEKYITSFRFAADSVFGEPYSDNACNGIVEKYKSKYDDLLNVNNLFDLIDILEELNNDKQHPENIASFLFSLEENYKVKEKDAQEKLSFNAMLRKDSENKIVFLMFYTAIIYHVAKIMKAKNLNVPRIIAFSGNGSKMIKIVTNSMDTLSEYTMAIFAKVYKKGYDDNGLTIKHNSGNPKAVTCKGGVLNPTKQSYEDIMNMKVVFSGLGDNRFMTNDDKYRLYIDDMDGFKTKTKTEVESFMNFFYSLCDEQDFPNKFGVDVCSIESAKNICKKDLDEYAKKGLELRKQEKGFDKNSHIVETSFFYPIQGAISALIEELNKNTDAK